MRVGDWVCVPGDMWPVIRKVIAVDPGVAATVEDEKYGKVEWDISELALVTVADAFALVDPVPSGGRLWYGDCRTASGSAGDDWIVVTERESYDFMGDQWKPYYGHGPTVPRGFDLSALPISGIAYNALPESVRAKMEETQ